MANRSAASSNRPPAKLRCAIYTRKSSEEGLEQNFSSLDAQREACVAFIASQKREGWGLIGQMYDDGGFSGATMERAAFQRLLSDVSAGRKIFARLADLEEPVDVVDIFRNSEAALGIVRDAIALKDKLGVKVIWMQLGVRNDEAAALAEAKGLKVVMNRCPKIEYGRLSGEIGWVGVNNRLISSRKPVMLGKGFQQLSIRPSKP